MNLGRSLSLDKRSKSTTSDYLRDSDNDGVNKKAKVNQIDL